MSERISLTRQAHQWLAERLQPGDQVIDATAGNGHDTRFLAEQVGPRGKVYAFDVQDDAITATGSRLQAHGLLSRVELIKASHADMASHIPRPCHGKLTACMFNLGYLPGSDKSIVTRAPDTLAALDQLHHLLQAGGVVSLLIYRGHSGGQEEYHCLQDHLCHTSGWGTLERIGKPAHDTPPALDTGKQS